MRHEHHPLCDDNGWDHVGPCVVESEVCATCLAGTADPDQTFHEAWCAPQPSRRGLRLVVGDLRPGDVVAVLPEYPDDSTFGLAGAVVESVDWDRSASFIVFDDGRTLVATSNTVMTVTRES